MRKLKKILYVILIIVIIDLSFATKVSNASSCFGSELSNGVQTFSNTGSKQLENMGIGENILDGLWDYVGDAYLIVSGIALITTIIVFILVNLNLLGSDGGKIYTPEERKQVLRQIGLVIALFGATTLIGVLLENFF